MSAPVEGKPEGKPMAHATGDAAENTALAGHVNTEAATPTEPPRYLAWTDRWDPGKWEMPGHPTPLQRVLAGIALIIVLVMTVWVPLRLLKIL